MTVRLMLTCLCDAFYGDVGIATVKVLEHVGCSVEFPYDQTCCGQPPFNSGDWASARKVAGHWKSVFGEADGSPIVTPSSSCAAMIREGYPLLFGEVERYPVFELGEFLVRRLGIDSWPKTGSARVSEKVAYHRACHGRGLHLGDEQERLLGSIAGLEVVPLVQPEQCCGFGGAFSVTHPFVSSEIGLEKLRHVVETGCSTLVSGDMGCLMHLRGLIGKAGLPIRTAHFAQILADAIPASVTA